MTRYLGAERRTTQVEKILTLVVESGSLYIVLYVSLDIRQGCVVNILYQTLQAVPIYGADLTPAGNMAFNVVNAVVQQAVVRALSYLPLQPADISCVCRECIRLLS